ncbi:hypothetical protein HPB51_013516 [Rhipicephalus microplus]|uniref:Uncharacterized protein n=1 Tax=Rhipicephalus microplus TaxID=6941 RepID=A0A9J6E1K6_RHIMP|nr:hypothetical protein HPB51_013516 [Rhipicephalus microplus]
MRKANVGVEWKIPSSENVKHLRDVSVEWRILNAKQLRYVNVEWKIPASRTVLISCGLGGTPAMSHSNPLDFFATRFFVLPWILMLLQNFDQPTWSPLSCGAGHLPVNASPRHDGVRQLGLYCALECASPPTLSLRWPHGHQLTSWISGTLSSDSAIVPWSTNINPAQTLTAPSGLGGTPAKGHPNPLDFFATQTERLENEGPRTKPKDDDEKNPTEPQDTEEVENTGAKLKEQSPQAGQKPKVELADQAE